MKLHNLIRLGATCAVLACAGVNAIRAASGCGKNCITYNPVVNLSTCPTSCTVTFWSPTAQGQCYYQVGYANILCTETRPFPSASLGKGLDFFWRGSGFHLQGVLGSLNHKPCSATLNTASQASGLYRRHRSEILITGIFLSFVHALIVRASTW